MSPSTTREDVSREETLPNPHPPFAFADSFEHVSSCPLVARGKPADARCISFRFLNSSCRVWSGAPL